MSIAWPDLAAALGLMLVLEGILPFLSPPGFRRACASLGSMDDRKIRLAGAAGMAAGVAVLFLARG
ncbi:MAG TPA: DUF2065 domain-containing protein [Steroidobacteraceae bacterium]|jgi:uncharacterized protein YjeT (DUF2065 family)|nr:DUF2065 domain-containing protein [Steroidobacteraceae bacterium]